jgi:hypothetical protein
MGIGEMLDGLACGVGGHIWVQDTGVQGVMSCSRCAGQADAAPTPSAASTDTESIVPKHRPWLEGPFLSDEE